MRVGYIRSAKDTDNAFEMNSVLEYLARLPEAMTGMFFSIILDIRHIPMWFPCQLHRLLSVAGKLTIELAEGEAAVYMDNEFVSPAKLEMLNQILALNPEVQIAGKLPPHRYVQSTDLWQTVPLHYPLHWLCRMLILNVLPKWLRYLFKCCLKSGASCRQKSLNAISETNEKLDAAGLLYESYLQNMGRQLFYIAAASYITIYLAVVFLIIAILSLVFNFLHGSKKPAGGIRPWFGWEPRMKHYAIRPENKLIGISASRSCCGN